MSKVNLEEIKLENTFVEMSEECQIATEGGCGGGGSITEGIRFKTKWGWVYW
ncbi:MAG: hypothetical protein K2M46_00325 [Lachnospiraceae bacterium]|nr:hypothetical protein [Lachnospiraceae bacterium]